MIMAEVRKKLEKQLELLFERDLQNCTIEEIAILSKTILDIVRILYL